MRPRRKVFAEGFIGETVECYRKAADSPTVRNSELKWAHDVLIEYFKAVELNGKIKSSYEIFRNCPSEVQPEAKRNTLLPSEFKPYKHSDLPKSKITFDELQHLFTKRRSVRWYQEREVEIERVTAAINIASLAPSACNRQPYRHIIIKDKETILAIANLAGGTKGFSHNIPLLIVSIGDLSAYPYERDRHLIYIDSSLANMQLLLALQTLGLDSCPINWPDIRDKDEKISKALQLPPHERVIMLISTGYALDEGEIPYSQKKYWEEITQII
ncbi:nitroreductase family protein [Halopseudomonas sabulinigri]|uniref:Nitroreductase domain-containing protein n=1 Tax=Halopseudomonas sabulinigri TaxID=472181 RepID=A0ABP9ZQ16_9GAMM